MRAERSRSLAAPVALALLLGLFAQGSRALWEPDEGRNANVAAAMLESGDFWIPRLSQRIYLDKPPLSYWAMAASRALVGPGELGIRLPGALAHAATTALVLVLGLAMSGRRVGVLAALLYATALAPFVAANVVTPDALLTVWVTACGWATWRAVRSGRAGWWIVAGAAAGMGVLTKGAAMFVFAAAFALGATLVARGVSWLARPGPWLAVVLAVLLSLPWFVSLARALPGATDYFLSNQISGRLFDDRYDRNPQWYRSVTLYVPTLVLGLLPWSAAIPVLWWRQRKAHPEAMAAEVAPAGRAFLAAWIVLPLVVFALARSRLPLYVLPLFAPITVVLAAAIPPADPERAGRRARLAFSSWVLLLAALKLGAAWVPARSDAARTAAFVKAELAAFPAELWVVDTDQWALPLYGAPEPRRAQSISKPYPVFEPIPALADELRASRPASFLVITTSRRHEHVAFTVHQVLDVRCAPSGRLDRLVALRCGDRLGRADLDSVRVDTAKQPAASVDGFEGVGVVGRAL